MRYFLIDKVKKFELGRSVSGIKNVTLTDEVLHDHFPDYPIMPGSLIIEASAQLAGFLLERTYEQEQKERKGYIRALLMQVKQAKFYNTAGAGDTLNIDVNITSLLDSAAQVSVHVRVEDKDIMKGELYFAMKEIESERLHQQREYIYKLWTKDLPATSL